MNSTSKTNNLDNNQKLILIEFIKYFFLKEKTTEKIQEMN